MKHHPIPSALYFGWFKLPQDRCQQHHPRMELAPYGKQQGRWRVSEGWKGGARVYIVGFWDLPHLLYKSFVKVGLMMKKDFWFMRFQMIYMYVYIDLWWFGFLMNLWWFLWWCWMISAAVGCWLSSTPHDQHHHPSSLHPEPRGRRTISCLADPLMKFGRIFFYLSVSPGISWWCWSMLDVGLRKPLLEGILWLCYPFSGGVTCYFFGRV